MNKKMKQRLALAAVVLLVVAAVLPFVFSLGSSEKSQELFRMSIAVAYLLPVLLFAILLAAKHQMRKNDKKEISGEINTIIFDVGNVLVDFKWEEYLDSFHYEKKKRECIADAVFRSEAWNLRDKGTYTEEEILEMFIEKAPQYAEEIHKVYENDQVAIKERDYARTWVQYLKKQGYKCYILSNYSKELLRKTKECIPIQEMNGAVFSCDVKSIKPEVKIYQILLEKYYIQPEKAVFIDDREENLKTAENLGIHTILFHDFKQVTKDLQKLGVE